MKPLLLLFLLQLISTATVTEDEDLPSFFDDNYNIYALIIGGCLILMSTLVSLYLCNLGDKRGRNELLGDLDGNDE